MDERSTDCATELCLGPSVERPQCHRLHCHHQQEVTFFYGGQACVFDLTEVQAKAIICMAKRDIDVVMKRNKCCLRESSSSSSPTSSDLQEQYPSPRPQLLHNLSLKRSLQRFLEERRTRMTRASTSPYYHVRHFTG